MKRSTVGLVLLVLIATTQLSFILVSCSDEIEMYEVVFDSQGGSDVSKVVVAAGQKLEEGATPKRLGNLEGIQGCQLRHCMRNGQPTAIR